MSQGDGEIWSEGFEEGLVGNLNENISEVQVFGILCEPREVVLCEVSVEVHFC